MYLLSFLLRIKIVLILLILFNLNFVQSLSGIASRFDFVSIELGSFIFKITQDYINSFLSD